MEQERFELTIEDLSVEGEGIGRIDGRVAFVAGALPGDRVLAGLSEDKGRFLRCKTMGILEASPDRIEPPCPNAAECGGCPVIALSYPAQLAWKEKLLRDCLMRIGGFELQEADEAENTKKLSVEKDEVEKIIESGAEAKKPLKFIIRPILPAEKPFFYRNKAEFAVENSSVGYYAAGSHRLCSMKGCAIQSEPALALAGALGDFLRLHPKNIYRRLVVRTAETGKVMAILVVNKNEISHAEELVATLDEAVKPPFRLASVYVNVNKRPERSAMGDENILIAGSRVIRDEIVTDLSTLKTELSPLAFSQVNPGQCSKLYSIVQRYAGLSGTEKILDLYCGTGSIGLSMAGAAQRVIGVESVKAAVIDANRNAVINGIVNAEFVYGKAEEVVDTKLQGVKADIVVLDPPRKGCDRRLLKTVAEIAPEKLIYVSCNPATLARDLKILSGLGFELIEATPVDMFPQTGHVETVVLLSKVDK